MSKEVDLLNYLRGKYKDVSISSLALKKILGILGNYKFTSNVERIFENDTCCLHLTYEHDGTPLLYRIYDEGKEIQLGSLRVPRPHKNSKPHYLLFSDLKLYPNFAGRINRKLSRIIEETGKCYSICQLGCDIVAISLKSESKILSYIKYYRSLELLEYEGFTTFPNRKVSSSSTRSDSIWAPHRYPTIISNYGITMEKDPVEDLSYWISKSITSTTRIRGLQLTI